MTKSFSIRKYAEFEEKKKEENEAPQTKEKEEKNEAQGIGCIRVLQPFSFFLQA